MSRRTPRGQEHPSPPTEEENIQLKYRGQYPIHDACAVGDDGALDVLAKRRDVNGYNKSETPISVVLLWKPAVLQEGVTPLHISCWQGYKDTVQKLLELGADVSLQDRDLRKTALHYACLGGHSAVVDLLLGYGAFVATCDTNGAYPMHMAAAGGHDVVIYQLIAAGSFANYPDADNAEPLHYAARHDQVAAIVRLNQHGANLEAKDKVGATPMHYAAEVNAYNAIEQLHELGALANVPDKEGNCPIHYASRKGKLGAIQRLSMVEVDLTARNKEKLCAIHLAADRGLPRSCTQLVKCGVDVSTAHRKGKTPLHIAAEKGHPATITALHACGADVNCEDKVGDRPLHYAVRAEHETSIQKLMQLGAKINASGKRGNTPLHAAVKENKAQIVYLLCCLQANCNAENTNCLFPIYYAALNGDAQIMRYLLRFGAEINKLNSEGQTMIEVMVEEEKLQALTVMKQLNANINAWNKDSKTCVHVATETLSKDVLVHLKSLSADVSAVDGHGMAAVHVATLKQSLDQINLLVELEADLNCQTKDFKRGEDDPPVCKAAWPPTDIEPADYWKHRTGMCAVHLAVINHTLHVLQHLVECGADINCSNDMGETVFHIAALFHMVDWYEDLIHLGADRNKPDKYGRAPLHYAAHSGNQNNVRYLLQNGAIGHAQDNDGRQPLHYACQGGHFLLMADLLAHSRAVDVNCRDSLGRTCMHFASEEGMIETMIELSALDCDVDVRDETGNTPLHLAAARGNYEAIVQLASMGADINAQNKDLKTALHLASEQGHGAAMEYLLMCGCNPSIRDKSDFLPTTFKVRGPLKEAVAKRIREFNTNRQSKYKTGEIDYQGRLVQRGKQVQFDRLQINVTLQCSTDVSPILFFHRTPTDDQNLVIPISGLEETLSDVYELRVLRLDQECSIQLELPMDGYPGKFEAALRTTDNKSFKSLTTSEESGVPIFVGKLPVQKDSAYRFAVVVRPNVDHHNVTSEGGIVMSELDRRIRVEMPKGTFSENTNLRLQVLETRDIEKDTEQLLAADVVNVTTRSQPHRAVTVRVPLHDRSLTQEDVMVFVIRQESDLYDDTKWRLVPSQWKVANQCVHFSAEHFSIFVTVKASVNEIHAVESVKRRAKDKLKRALQRETAVLFFYAVNPKKETFLTIFECTSPGKFQRRSEFWEREGFVLHPQVRHSGHFVAKPNQMYQIGVSGNIAINGGEGRRLSLIYNPRAYKYQSFYLTVINQTEPHLGQIDVFQMPETSRRSRKNQPENSEDGFLTSLPVELPQEKNGCILS